MNILASLKRGLLLLGSLIIAYIAAQFFHELCHSTAAYLNGGNFGKIFIHPFSWSYSYSSSPNVIFHLAAGPFGASLIGMLIFLISYRWIRLQLLPILLIAPVIFFENGGYLLIDTLMRSGGDACRLINYGVPPSVIISLVVILLGTGVVSTVLVIKKTGLLNGKFNERLITLGIGVLTYTSAMLIWHYFYNFSEIKLWLTYAVYETVLVLIVAVIPVKNLNQKIKPVSWKIVSILNLLAVFLISFLLLQPQAKNSFDLKTYSERPNGFPEIIIVPDMAEEVHYSVFSRMDSKIYKIRFMLPTRPNKLSRIISESDEYFISKNWIKLKHSLVWPEQKLTGENWEQQYWGPRGEKQNKYYYRFLEYTDNHNQKAKLEYSFKEVPDNDKDIKLHVSQTFFKGKGINAQLLKYRQLHPEEFGKQSINEL